MTTETYAYSLPVKESGNILWPARIPADTRNVSIDCSDWLATKGTIIGSISLASNAGATTSGVSKTNTGFSFSTTGGTGGTVPILAFTLTLANADQELVEVSVPIASASSDRAMIQAHIAHHSLSDLTTDEDVTGVADAAIAAAIIAADIPGAVAAVAASLVGDAITAANIPTAVGNAVTAAGIPAAATAAVGSAVTAAGIPAAATLAVGNAITAADIPALVAAAYAAQHP